MSSFLEEIIKSNTTSDHREVPGSFFNHDKLEVKIKNEINSMEKLTQEDNDKSLNSNAENWMFYLKKNIMDEYENMKNNFKEISKIIIIKEIKIFENEMNRLKDEVFENQSHISKLSTDILNYKMNIKCLSDKLSTSRDKKIEAHCFYQWRLLREQRQRQIFCEKIAIKFHESTLKRKVFYGWKYNLEVTWKDRNNSKIERNAKSVCQGLVDEYEKQIVELKAEVSKLQEQNSMMQTSRSTTQDAVKKALMRGVCALNMETMSILNQNGIITENSNDNNFITSNRSVHISPDLYTNNNGLYEDDQPRFPLNKYYPREKNDSNHSSYRHIENYEQSLDNKMKISSEDIYYPSKLILPQYQPSSMLSDRSNNQNTVKSTHLYETKFSNHKTIPSKTSTITIQAGNPTGSHTQSSNSSLNVTVQKHSSDELPNNSTQKRSVENYPDRRFHKK